MLSGGEEARFPTRDSDGTPIIDYRIENGDRHRVRWTPKTGPGNKVDFPWFNFGGEDGR
jgi:hypothetical protein